MIHEAESIGLPAQFPRIGPEAVLGIEVNPYAAELARVTIWIGEIQWMMENGFGAAKNPVLKPLNQIECRDAILTDDGNEPEWPEADVIVGNPPFLGGSKMLSQLGSEYCKRLRDRYEGRVPGGADLVTYWFEKARERILAGKTTTAGLVATNSIRGGASRKVLDRIVESGSIFEAWSDEEWVNEGAAVRVSLVCFRGSGDGAGMLDGKPVSAIHADLTAGEGVELTTAKPLVENEEAWAYGSQEKGDFAIAPDVARQLLLQPNPHGKPNSDVVKRAVNAKQIVKRREDAWVIDFGLDMTLEQASLYEGPFEIVKAQVAPLRLAGRDKSQAKRWWRHARPSPKYRAWLNSMPRLIATPCVAKHRVFVFLGPSELVDHQLVVFPRDDYTAFGILHSKIHETWSLRMCTWLGVGNDPRYTPSTTFETFPFPKGLSPNVPASNYGKDPRALRIASAAKELNELRENWLNPTELVERLAEVVPGYPDRLIARNEAAEKELKKRTLTNLYNANPDWLLHAHREVDKAVALAYGWDWPLAEDEVLKRLLELNRERSRSAEAAVREETGQPAKNRRALV